MTKRIGFLTLTALFCLLCGLSTGGELFFLLFYTLVLMALLSLAAALWTARTLSVACTLQEDSVERGGQVNLSIRIAHRCPLPVAPLRLTISVAADTGQFELLAHAPPFRETLLDQALYCPHVGEYPAGVSKARVGDVFGLFAFRRSVGKKTDTLVVTPQVYVTPPLAFSPGDADNESMVSKAFEDATMPTDVRAYQQGDELKRVHWKLSMRKKELLVRVYEQPMKPDALLLVDCAQPACPGAMAPAIRDAICEAAASVASAALTEGAPVRMPLLTDVPTDVNAARQEDLPGILHALGRCAFDGTEAFERVLLLETRRLRRTGSTAIVTSRMNPVIADMILRIRRMGPKVRVLLAADTEDETIALLVHRLMRNDVEVTPISAELA